MSVSKFTLKWYMILAVRDFQGTKETIAHNSRQIDDTLQTSNLSIKFSFNRRDLPNQNVSVHIDFYRARDVQPSNTPEEGMA